MKKTLYLHIGIPKTGTTAIQVFLRKNRRELSRRGYFVCTAQDTIRSRNLRFLTAHLQVFGLQGLRAQGWLSGDDRKDAAVLSRWFEAFVRRLSRVKEKSVILSEEMLWWALCDGEKLNILLERLKPFFDIKLIVYLRRQDHYIMSIYQQALKACNVDAKTCPEWIATPENWQVSEYTGYDRCLDKLVGYVGQENIILRLYEPQQLQNESLIDDFAQCVGIDRMESLFVPQKNINPGLNAKGVALARCMNRVRAGSGFMPFISRFDGKRQLLNDRGAAYTFLTLEERRAFLKTYEAGNQQVAERFFGRKELFMEPPPDPSEQALAAVPDEDVLPILLTMIDELSEQMAAGSFRRGRSRAILRRGVHLARRLLCRWAP